MRLIDASTTKVSITRFFERHVSHQKSKRLKEHSYELCRDMCFAIDAQQTIDAVPVVRCRDCKYFDYDMERCNGGEHPTSPDAFCSWAERRSDE